MPPEPKKPANQQLVRAVWDEARDLIKGLSGDHTSELTLARWPR